MAEDVPPASLLRLSIGIIAGGTALLSLLALMSFAGNDIILTLGTHVVGGTSDRLAAGLLATLSGAVAVFTLLRSSRRL